MTRYNFLWVRRVILSNVRTKFQRDLISILVNFACELEQIGGSFEKKYQSGDTIQLGNSVARDTTCGLLDLSRTRRSAWLLKPGRIA